jgi:hypothetical protein
LIHWLYASRIIRWWLNCVSLRKTAGFNQRQFDRQPPCRTTAEVYAQFGADFPVVDGLREGVKSI